MTHAIRDLLGNQLIGLLRISKSRKKFLLPVAGLGAAFLALTAVYPGPVAAGETQGVSAPELEGTWRVRVTPVGGDPSFVALHTFTQGGAMMESNQSDALQTPGHGVWRRNGPRSFGFTFEKFVFGPAGNFLGTVRVSEVDQLDAAGQFKTGTGTVTVLDPAGNVVVTGLAATTSGTRMAVQAP